MTMYARECGSMVPADAWNGRVVSRHAGFLNLLHPDGVVVSVLVDHRHMHPFGIRIQRDELARMDSPPDSAVSMTDGFLKIDRKWVIALSSARRWSGAVNSCSEGQRDTATIGALAAAIGEHAGSEGFGSLAIGGPEDYFADRASSVLQAAMASPGPMDLSRLVGLGIGLTPSGDDFLAGVLAAEAAFNESQGHRPVHSIDRGVLSARLQSTSPAGRTLMRGALAGQFPKYLVDLIEALCAPLRGVRMLREAVDEAAAHGATSGIDSCTGVWWWLDQISGRSENQFRP
jgi:hypothetical protein